jgi:hypothetical protein
MFRWIMLLLLRCFFVHHRGISCRKYGHKPWSGLQDVLGFQSHIICSRSISVGIYAVHGLSMAWKKKT